VRNRTAVNNKQAV